MSFQNISTVIRKRRKELNIQGYDLCIGICTFVSFCRIESGEETPEYETLCALMARLGYPEPYAELPLQISNYASVQNVSNAMHLYLMSDFEGAAAILRVEKEKGSLLKYQSLFLNMVETQIKLKNGIIDAEKALELLEELIKKLYPLYEKNNLPKVMSITEVIIIKVIASVYSLLGLHSDAESIMRHIYDYSKLEILSADDCMKWMPVLYADYSKCLYMVGKYDEAISTAEEAIDICCLNGRYLVMPEVNMTLAMSLIGRGGQDDYEYAKKAVSRAYNLCFAMDIENEITDQIKHFMDKTFNNAVQLDT